MAPARTFGILCDVRYRVTLSSPGIPTKTYEVEAASEGVAAAKATGRFMAENRRAKQFAVSAVIHALGPAP